MKKIIVALLLMALVLSVWVLPASAEAEPTLIVGDTDLDGSVTAVDALLVLQISIRKCMPPTAPDENASFEEKADWYYYRAKFVVGNVNGDEKFGSDDALLILKFVVGKVDQFPLTDITQTIFYDFLPAWPGDAQ